MGEIERLAKVHNNRMEKAKLALHMKSGGAILCEKSLDERDQANVSKKDKVRVFLENYGTLTVLEAQHLFRTTELRTIISRLRNDGYKIISKREGKNNHHRYRIDPSTLGGAK